MGVAVPISIRTAILRISNLQWMIEIAYHINKKLCTYQIVKTICIFTNSNFKPGSGKMHLAIKVLIRLEFLDTRKAKKKLVK